MQGKQFTNNTNTQKRQLDKHQGELTLRTQELENEIQQQEKTRGVHGKNVKASLESHM